METFSLLCNRARRNVKNSLESFSHGGSSEAREREAREKMGQFEERDP
jgi:hypothetical protein